MDILLVLGRVLFALIFINSGIAHITKMQDELRRTRGVIGYTYAPPSKSIEPFKRFIRSNSKWLSLIRDFNFNYAPSQVAMRADVFRQFGATRPRNVGGGPYKIPETYNKYFTFDRYYILQWNLTRSLAMDFSATNNARIDEPPVRIVTGKPNPHPSNPAGF